MIHYRIKLTQSEIEELSTLVKKGSRTSQAFRAASILLSCDESKCSKRVTNEQISKVLRVGLRTIERVKKKFIEDGLEGVLERRPTTRTYEKKMDGEAEAKLITLCCREPPKGYAKWSLRLLADTMVELKYVESVSHVTVSKVLKKTNLSRGK